MAAPLPVYVIHYRGAPERKAHMLRQLAEAGFGDVTFAENDGLGGLSEAEIARYYRPAPERWHAMTDAALEVLTENAQFHPAKQSWPEGVVYTMAPPPFRSLRPAEIAPAREHFRVYEEIIRKHQDAALVLEDDVILAADFHAALLRHLPLTPPDWDFIFMGSGCGLRVPGRREDVAVYKMVPPRSKCADSYLIRGRAAAMLARFALPLIQPLDWELGYWMARLNLNTYWWEPPSVVQGSQSGLFASLLR
jgi:GR25 family glycosyltransferase involved in LPS biosynthesis